MMTSREREEFNRIVSGWHLEADRSGSQTDAKGSWSGTESQHSLETLDPLGKAVIADNDVFRQIMERGGADVQQELLGRVNRLCEPAATVPHALQETDLRVITWGLQRLHGAQLMWDGYLQPQHLREAINLTTDLPIESDDMVSDCDKYTVQPTVAAMVKLGYLRKRHNALLRTQRGIRAWNSLTDLFDLTAERLAQKKARTFETDAGELLLLCLATSDGTVELDVATRFLNAAGWHLSNGAPIDEHVVAAVHKGPALIIQLTGPVGGPSWHAQKASPTAIAISRAALLRV